MKITIAKSDFGQPEPIDPDALIREGWIYVDPPTRFSHEMWDLWCSSIGEGNFRILAMTSGVEADGFKYKRGQFLISPTGRQRLLDYAAQRRAETAIDTD